MVYTNHVEYSFLCPSPSCSLLVAIHFWHLMFRYLALVSISGVREPSADIPIPSFLGKAYKQRSKTILMIWKDWIPIYIFLLWTWKKKLLLVQRRMVEHQGVAFCSFFRFVCLLFVNFSAKLYSSYLNISSPTSLRQSVNRSWSHSCWVFLAFFFLFAQL